MKYYKLSISFIIGLGLLSQNSFCSESNVMSTTQQVSQALNQWFGKRTLITAGAFIGSALLGVALYKAMTRWAAHYFSPKTKDEDVNIQEIPNNVVEQLKATNQDPDKIKELIRRNPSYKDYIEAYSLSIKN